MTNKPPILDYANPQPATRWHPLLVASLRVFVLTILLIMVGLFLPNPRGIWYFGPGNRWFVAIDYAGLTLRTSTGKLYLSNSTVLFLKCLLIAIPAWAIWKLLSRLRRKRATGV